MPKLDNGLFRNPGAKFWSYHFKWRGRQYRGSTGLESKVMAKEWLRALRERIANEEVGLVAPATVTLGNLLEAWTKAENHSLTSKHIKDRDETIRTHLSSLLNTPCHEITTEDLDETRVSYLSGTWASPLWKDALPKPRTKGGWNRVRRHLLALYRWGIDRGLVKEIPFKLKPQKPQEEVKSVVWPEQVPAFLAAVDSGRSQDAKTAIRLMLQLGLREDEALTSRWEWMDLAAGIYRTGDAKSRDVRTIDLPEGLGQYIAARHTPRDHGLILVGGVDENGNEIPHDEGFTRKAIVRGGAAIGTVGMTPHAMRRTFATAHWEAGTSIGDLTAMMGHKDPTTTMGYIVQRGRNRRESQDRVAALMGVLPAENKTSVRIQLHEVIGPERNTFVWMCLLTW